MDTKLIWKEKKELEMSADLQKVLSNNMVEDIYEIHEAEDNGIKYTIIVADNGAYFKPGAEVAVNLLVQGKEMTETHSASLFKKEYCVGKVYLSNIFCIFDDEEAKEKINYIKDKVIELAS